MKKFTIPLFAALIGFSGLATAASELITENTTSITSDGQTYSTGSIDLSSFIGFTDITLDLLAAGDYSKLEKSETFTFKLDDITIAFWSGNIGSGTNTPLSVSSAAFDLGDIDASQSYKTLSASFDTNTLIDDATFTTFGAAWDEAISDGQVTISWTNDYDFQLSEGVDYLDYLDERVSYSIQGVSAVPEPSTYALMLAGLGLVGFMAHRRRKA